MVSNLEYNFRLNNRQNKVGWCEAEQLDWSDIASKSPDSMHRLAKYQPEIVIACDTVYLPEHLHALASTLKFCLEIQTQASTQSSLDSYKIKCTCPKCPEGCSECSIQRPSPHHAASCAQENQYFSCRFALLAQTERNSETYDLYLKELRSAGLYVNELLRWATPLDATRGHSTAKIACGSSLSSETIGFSKSARNCPLFINNALETAPTLDPANAPHIVIDSIPQRFAYQRHHTQRLHTVTLACKCPRH